MKQKICPYYKEKYIFDGYAVFVLVVEHWKTWPLSCAHMGVHLSNQPTCVLWTRIGHSNGGGGDWKLGCWACFAGGSVPAARACVALLQCLQWMLDSARADICNWFCSGFLWTEFLGTAKGLQKMWFYWLHQTMTSSLHQFEVKCKLAAMRITEYWQTGCSNADEEPVCREQRAEHRRPLSYSTVYSEEVFDTLPIFQVSPPTKSGKVYNHRYTSIVRDRIKKNPENYTVWCLNN